MNELEMIERLTKVEDRSKSNTRRLEDVEKRLDDNETMIASIVRIDQKQTDMDNALKEIKSNDLKEIKADVKALAEKPAKRWDGLITAVISTAAGGLVGALLTLLLK